MIYSSPPRLQAGDKVRVIAPSGPVPVERFEAGLACLCDWGLVPVYEPDLLDRYGYFAGTDQRRLQELLIALNDAEAKAIWCARGGYGASRLLSGIQPDQVPNKVLIGFSDITVLHTLWQRAGKQSAHACNLTGLSEWQEADRRALQQGLFEGCWPALKGRCSNHQGMVQGAVLGGNLTVLAALAGTGFLPDFRGAIVCLEDVSERPYRLDRSLTQLIQTGVFAETVGFVIGQLTSCYDLPSSQYDRNALSAILDVLEPLDVPILTHVPVGHERTALPLVLGANMILDSAQAQLRYIT